LSEEVLGRGLSDQDSRVVEQAIQLCAEGFPESEKLLEQLYGLAEHPDVRVRFQLGLALGEMRGAKVGETLAKLVLKNAGETWVRAAAMSSSTAHAEAMLREIVEQAGASHDEIEVVNALMATLVGSQEDGILAGLELVTQSKLEEKLQLSVLATVVLGIERRQSSLAELNEKWDEKGKELLRSVDGMLGRAREIAVDAQQPEELREISLSLLGRGIEGREEDLKRLTGLVNPGESQQLQITALSSLSRLSDPEISVLLLSNWKSQSPLTQGKILQVLLSRSVWTADLVTRIERGELSARDLDASSRGTLFIYPDQEIKERARKVMVKQATESRQKVLAEYDSVKGLKGDQGRGRDVFKKTCAACHKYREEGTQIGANLASLQDRTTGALLTAILDPNQAVEGKYKSYAAALKDGRILNGMIVEESATNITLAAANGTLQTLLRSELEELASNGISFMPEGLEKDLTQQDVADVIAFLQTDGAEK